MNRDRDYEPLNSRSVLDRMVEKIKIEKRSRSKLDSFLVYGHYSVDYIILWAIVGLSI